MNSKPLLAINHRGLIGAKGLIGLREIDFFRMPYPDELAKSRGLAIVVILA